jgi:hypothetical protein
MPSNSARLFDGYQTINRIRSAESGVLQTRAGLRLSEQSTLLDGVTAYEPDYEKVKPDELYVFDMNKTISVLGWEE